MPDRIAYKVMLEAEVEEMRREGVFAGSAADSADGFIHLSCGGQLAGTVEKYFASLSGVMVAVVDLALLGETVRWEASRDGQLFPHVYGVLPVGAVISVGALERGVDGMVRVPGV